jgi:hypothetical protein
MTTEHKNFKSVSGGSRNDALSMYIHYKIPKSRETVPLCGVPDPGRKPLEKASTSDIVV